MVGCIKGCAFVSAALLLYFRIHLSLKCANLGVEILRAKVIYLLQTGFYSFCTKSYSW